MSESDFPGHPHALVVEDHEDSRDMMRQLLEHAGMVVTAVASADDALRVARGQTLAIVLTDLSLGNSVRDGVWLLHRLRRAFRDLPIVAVTGRKERADELLDMGFAAVLVKPTIADDLIATIRRTLGRPPRD